MKKGKYLILLCALFLITGCKNTPKLENGQEVVVEIEGKQFTADDFFIELKEEYGTSILISLVDNYITDKEISDEEKKEAEKEAQAEYDQYYAYYGSDWNSFLSYYGYNSSDELLEDLVKNYKQTKVLNKYIKGNVITKEEINEYYEKDIYGEITVRHILITPEVTDDMTDSEKTEAKNKALEEAKNLIEQLNKSEKLEEDFIALAKEKSDDPGSASEGGLIENFTNESGLVEEFWNASLKLEVGKMTSEPVESDYGYHIIYKVKQNDKPSLDTVKDTIITKITEKLLSDSNSSYIYWSGLREKYGMKIYDDTIKDTYTATMNNLKNK
ncbi:MAG: peptidylprolyl isomerase [Bacilli bacterium]|nr:peptidylprolyl isomerase [Bacilli bacterium]